MIASYTQTYSNNRQQLFYFKNKDIVDIGFRNLFDLNLYCFHNSSDAYINDALKEGYIKDIKWILEN
jgi:hypothetical protein